ncbi:MAG: HAD-IB family hydrolase [Calditrichaceae bacterium]|nr:HAD-IB family hydrolase [Calditrichaceae bacterium]
MKKYVAFFDLDHTILDVNSGRILIEQAHKKGLVDTKKIFLAYMFSALYGIGLLRAEYIMLKLADWLKGIAEKEFAAFTSEMFEKYLKNTVRQQAIKEIQRHKKHDAKLVILSAATSYVCESVKKMLGFDDLLCSKMEVIDGFFSGFPDGPYCYGDEKLNQVIDYCEKHNFNLKETFYYADSHSDIVVLEAIGNPICVTPDRKLKKLAQKKDWPVYNW